MKNLWLFERIVQRGDDSTTIFTKKVFSVSCIVGSILSAQSMIFNRDLSWVIIQVMCLVLFAVCLSQMIIERRLRHGVVEVQLYISAFAIIITDTWSYLMNGVRTWQYYVVLLDMCLVMRLDRRVARNLVISCVAYLLVIALEDWLRFGFYDLSILPSQDARRGALVSDCSDLPCKQTFQKSVLGTLLVSIIVFALDYYFTRTFANGMYSEIDKMNTAISATEQIASSLSRFDLQDADEILNTASLPAPLDTAFRQILANLEMYRPYLPQSVLVKSTGSEHSDSSPALTSTDSHVRQAVRCRTLEQKYCSFSVTNMIGSHDAVTTDSEGYAERYKIYLEQVIECYSLGVVGVVVGDHVHASFNAVKKCVPHSEICTKSAMRLYFELRRLKSPIEVSIGVSTGQVYCGRLGCRDMMSANVIGPAVVAASVLQDFAHAQLRPVVCTASVYKNIENKLRARIVLSLVRLCDRNEVVYELDVSNESVLDEADTRNAEWMYEFHSSPLQQYNDAAKKYVLGNRTEALRLLRNQKGNDEDARKLQEWVLRDSPVKVYGPGFMDKNDKTDQSTQIPDQENPSSAEGGEHSSRLEKKDSMREVSLL
eukprot:TRINITY_DN5146_c0_g1_i2.p1 TRINITY_DN5146_c0_g1~~TRINITY_DN5146_c0_g1_i2.p1  ORF type:complete len:613 (+),score=121.99 TRINITY_DN5146_c0_g1_i2:46-1839(+)